MSGGGTFALDLQKFAAKAGARVDDAVGRIVFLLAADLDYFSPVGDAEYWKSPPPKGYVGGHFRANWQLGVGKIPAEEKPGVDTSAKNEESGGTTTAHIQSQIPEEAGGKVYYLANNAPYALRLEYGWSRQAPRGVVARATANVGAIVVKAIIHAKAAHP